VCARSATSSAPSFSTSTAPGFVERLDNPEDGRSFLLRLTPSGRDAWRRAATNLWQVVESLEARLSRPTAEIQQVLGELQEAFDAEGAGARAARR
jgi:DNA-binding MarR family transcriptional regulator